MMVWSPIEPLVLFPLQLIGGIVPFVLRLRRRSYFPVRVAIALMMIFLFLLAFSRVHWTPVLEQPTEFIRAWMFLMLIVLTTTLAVWYIFKIRWIESVFSVTLGYLTEHIAYSLRLILSHLFPSFQFDPFSSMYFVIHLSVYIIAYVFLSRQMMEGHHYEPETLQSVWLSLSTVLLVVIMSLVSQRLNIQWVHGMYALFACYFVLASQLNRIRQLRSQRELHHRQQIWLKHRSQYELTRKNIDMINFKSHDLRHQVSAIRRMIDTSSGQDLGILAMLDDLERSVHMHESIIETGNDILDTILTEKSMWGRSQGVTVHCIADGTLLDFMESMDVFSFFGNILENAIRAASQVGNNSIVKLHIAQKAGLVLVRAENPFHGDIVLVDGYPRSTKMDSGYHGYGLRSIFSIAEKYGGFADFSYINENFVLRITFPISDIPNTPL